MVVARMMGPTMMNLRVDNMVVDLETGEGEEI